MITGSATKISNISDHQLQGEYRSVGLFMDNAKTYIQLSTGALLLSVTFSESISSRDKSILGEAYLLSPWLFWLLTIIAGATYQYCATKYLEKLESLNGSLFYKRVQPIFFLRHWCKNPYRLYGAMISMFYLGTILFAFSAISRLAT